PSSFPSSLSSRALPSFPTRRSSDLPGFGADFQFPVQHDPLGGQFKVSVVGEAEFAVDRQTAQRRRTDVEDHVLAFFNGDLVACEDRKSTRLNSSHQIISYAVLCLKK